MQSSSPASVLILFVLSSQKFAVSLLSRALWEADSAALAMGGIGFGEFTLGLGAEKIVR